MIIVEDGPGGGPALFSGARRLIVARRGDQVAPLLAALDAARAEGWWVAGWLGYEAGHALEPRLAALRPEAPAPLAVFGLYPAPAMPRPCWHGRPRRRAA